jgi:hypothetical protein
MVLSVDRLFLIVAKEITPDPDMISYSIQAINATKWIVKKRKLPMVWSADGRLRT